MKYYFIIFFLLFAHIKSVGQTAPSQICGIWYDYDNAGNRIKRYYDCKTFDGSGQPPANPADPGGAGTTAGKPAGATDGRVSVNDVVNVYPNPFKDYFIIHVQKTAPGVHFHLYDAKGSIVYSGTFSGGEARVNINNLTPGAYNLAVRYNNNAYFFKLVKLD